MNAAGVVRISLSLRFGASPHSAYAFAREFMMSERISSVPAGETILVADDTDAIRLLVMRVLGRAGYNCLEAHHGAEALRIAADHDGKIDLFISDIYMPGLRAPEVTEQLRLTRPDLRVLYMSGFADEDVARSGGAGERLLRKPFSGEQLYDAVREAIASPASKP